MVFILVLLTIFVALSHTLALNENTSSNCFDQTGFEQQNYGDMSSKAWLNFGVVALIDYRYTAQLTQTRMQQTVDELNTYFAASKIRLVNLQLYLLDQQYAPDLTMETADGSDWETPEIKQNWRTAATPVLGQGNVVFVFHSIKVNKRYIFSLFFVCLCATYTKLQKRFFFCEISCFRIFFISTIRLLLVHRIRSVSCKVRFRKIRPTLPSRFFG